MRKQQGVRTINKKIEEVGRHKLFKYEQKYRMKKMIIRCDSAISRIVRMRDCWLGIVPCVSQWIPVCKWPISFGIAQCCHWISRKYYNCRRDLRNLYAGCASCNFHWLQDHNNAITARIIKEHWVDVWNEMRENRTTKKPSYEEMCDLWLKLSNIEESLKKTCNHNKKRYYTLYKLYFINKIQMDDVCYGCGGEATITENVDGNFEHYCDDCHDRLINEADHCESCHWYFFDGVVDRGIKMCQYCRD